VTAGVVEELTAVVKLSAVTAVAAAVRDRVTECAGVGDAAGATDGGDV
jgi:hypothetical protein